MTNDDTARFQELMGDLYEMFGCSLKEPPTEKKIALYWKALSNMSIERVELGCKNWIEDGRSFPFPAQIREAAGPPEDVNFVHRVTCGLCGAFNSDRWTECEKCWKPATWKVRPMPGPPFRKAPPGQPPLP